MKQHIQILVLSLLFVSNFGYAQNVLFVGNSLTYSNDLPEILERIAKDFNESIETTSLCFPNYGLEDHWLEGKFHKLMNQNKYDFVIVQQGPSSQPLGRKMLLEYGAKIKAVCKVKNTELAYFMVWPSKYYYYTFDGVIDNHREAAKVNSAKLFPVGVIWKAYGEQKKHINLYSNDDFHPSKAGSFLAALTIFHGLHPEKKLHKINYKTYKKWVKDEASFNAMIDLITKG